MKDEKNISQLKEIMDYFPIKIKNELLNIKLEYLKTITEIRIKKNCPIILCFPNDLCFLGKDGMITKHKELAKIVCNEDFREIYSKICEFSIYSFEDKIIKGFITIKGGHRIGIIGTAILNNNEIISIKDISSLNIRISREKIGCATEIVNQLGCNLKSSLIISPPSGGKTTVLRDLARELSSSRKKVAIIDERGEIASVYNGICNKDIGVFTDVLDAYPKSTGIMIAIKSMSPHIILCDEVSSKEEFEAISECFKNGVTVIATMHAENYEELLTREYVKEYISSGIIKNVIELFGSTNPGKIKKIISNEKVGV